MLNFLFQEPVFRSQLVASNWFSRTTISNLVDEFMQQGIIFEEGF